MWSSLVSSLCQIQVLDEDLEQYYQSSLHYDPLHNFFQIEGIRIWSLKLSGWTVVPEASKILTLYTRSHHVDGVGSARGSRSVLTCRSGNERFLHPSTCFPANDPNRSKKLVGYSKQTQLCKFTNQKNLEEKPRRRTRPVQWSWTWPWFLEVLEKLCPTSYPCRITLYIP